MNWEQTKVCIRYFRIVFIYLFFARVLSASFGSFLVSYSTLLFTTLPVFKCANMYQTHTHMVSLRPTERAREQLAPHKNRPHKTPCHFD